MKSVLGITGASVRERAAASAWLELLRPRVAVMVIVVTFVGGMLAPTGEGALRALEAALYVALVTGCASVLNQVLERDTDALMERTRARPLVTGRVGVRDALFFAAFLGAAGTAGLALSFNLLAALLVLATLVVYAGIYTPMKRVSSLNTVIGAIPGAAPPVIGYVALAGEPGPWAGALFATLFAWQFPHFMAIAWLYRRDYARAGMRMLPALPGSEGAAGRQALLYCLTLIPVSLLPLFQGLAGPVYGVGATIVGFAYLAPSIAFARRETRARARAVVLVSLAYLPLLFVLTLFDPMVRAAIGA